MRYEGSVYRPPSEGRSLIIQVTIGCSHNKCTFCSMYKEKKFRIRPLAEILEDIDRSRGYNRHVRRIFLADGDALILKTKDLVTILDHINKVFPECERIGVYATPRDILNKTSDALRQLKNHGLKMMYMGVESGSDRLLTAINKGASHDQIKEAGIKAREAGIKLSVTLISGLGGKSRMKEHALASAKLMNAMNPDYIGLLTLMLEAGTPLYRAYKKGDFELLSPEEIMLETKLFIENLEVNDCIFRSNHASNYIPLAGTLCEEKEELLETINRAMEKASYKEEGLRLL